MVFLSDVVDAIDKVTNTLQKAIDKYGPALVHASQQQVQASINFGFLWTKVFAGLAALSLLMLGVSLLGVWVNNKRRSYGEAEGWTVTSVISITFIIVFVILTAWAYGSTMQLQQSYEWQVIQNLRSLSP